MSQRLANKHGKYACACCDNYTIDVPGTYEICEICYWEDDPVQLEEPDLPGGANSLSLNQAKRSWFSKIQG
ncbi:hypothetical protein J2X76_006364 [Neorhizobium sp. 2083]|uniref:CPCC family cysteine-rich protein n=1 Tax=Neorhizobium sp. 2083 TaxID=2817762 RepID=UPI0028576CAF|nr:hypothetical protein [Neorhizobium sp. 2083]